METQNSYKRTVAGSVGAGMGALFGGSNKTFYMLEHKTSSKYHDAGETQKIIVDQVELGRDAECQVRFDESFETVSRKHAAIVREGEGWKLVHLSKSNPTLVNGQPVQDTYYLQSGDEIQLSHGGPLMGFIVPQGDKARTSTISLSERMTLFRKQALRPYRVALWIIGLILIAAIAALCFYLNKKNVENKAEQDALKNEIELKNQQLKEAIDGKVEGDKQAVSTDMKDYYSRIYSLKINRIRVEYDGNAADLPISSSDFDCGTGFLLEDGTFVTARKNVQPWVDVNDNEEPWREMLAMYYTLGFDIIVDYDAYSTVGTANKLSFSSRDFTFDENDKYEYLPVKMAQKEREELTKKSTKLRKSQTMKGAQAEQIESIINEKKKEITLRVLKPVEVARDYAVIRNMGTAGIPANSAKAESLAGGQELLIAGYKGNTDVHQLADYIDYRTTHTSRADTQNSTIVLQGITGTEGHVGAPAFIKESDGTYRVIGVMTGARDGDDRLVPISLIMKK